MAFKFQHGDVTTAIQMGELVGGAEKARRQEEQALKFAMQVQEQRNRVRLAEMQMEANFQAQVADQTFKANMENIRNQNNFEFLEQKRLNELGMQHMQDMKKKAGYEATLEAINNNERFSEDEKERARINVTAKYNLGTSVISPTDPTIDKQREAERHAMAVERHEKAMAAEDFSQSREERAAAADLRAQERHDAALAGGVAKTPSFAQKKAAAEFLADKTPHWYQWDDKSDTTLALMEEARAILAQERVVGGPTVIRQRNKTTGQTRVSYDGGKTWQTE